MRTSYANQIEKKQEQLEKLEESMQKLQLRKQSIKLKMQSAKDAIDELNSKRHKKWYVDLEKEINRHGSQINLDVIPVTDIVHYIIEETVKYQSKSDGIEPASLKKVQEKEATVSTSENTSEKKENPSAKEQLVKPDKDSKPSKAAEPVESVAAPLNQVEDKNENEGLKTNKVAEPVEPVEPPLDQPEDKNENEDSSPEPAWTPPETF